MDTTKYRKKTRMMLITQQFTQTVKDDNDKITEKYRRSKSAISIFNSPVSVDGKE